MAPPKPSLTPKQRTSEIVKAKRFVNSLHRSERWELNDRLVLGDFDWRDYFESRPTGTFLNAVADELSYQEQTERDLDERASNDYVVINYHDVGSRIVRGPVRVRSATEAIERAVKTPHSSIEVHDPNGWVLRTLVFSPKHPIDRSTLNKLLMR